MDPERSRIRAYHFPGIAHGAGDLPKEPRNTVQLEPHDLMSVGSAVKGRLKGVGNNRLRYFH